jgi:hypothetical protein
MHVCPECNQLIRVGADGRLADHKTTGDAWGDFVRCSGSGTAVRAPIAPPPPPRRDGPARRPGGRTMSDDLGPEPIPMRTYRHVKTASLYLVLGTATCSTNGPGENRDRSVIYVPITPGKGTVGTLRYRDLAEFMDGRFVLEDRS